MWRPTAVLSLALSMACGPTPPEAPLEHKKPGSSTDAGHEPGADGGPGHREPSEPSLRVERGVNLDGFMSDVYTWLDASGRPRSAAMARNDARDPTGNYGGGLRRLVYEVGGQTRVATAASDRYPCFGYAVSHYTGGAALTGHVAGDHRVLFEGAHHAVHEYRWRVFIGSGNVDITIWWVFASGRDDPLYAITYDARPAGENVVHADSRAPYGELEFDDGQNLDVDGVGWGDRYRFRTTSAGPVTLQSAWTYVQPNQVPHVLAWSDAANAEMGLVQTMDWARQDAGGFWFYGSWGTSSSGPMPEDWNWPYQLNQYELPFTTKSHRMAWGTNYGAVGQTSYPAYGDDKQLSGYPFQSYAVLVSLGQKGLVDEVVGNMESLLDASLTCAVGSVAQQVEGGAGRDDLVLADPAGYHPVFAAHEVVAAGGAFDCSLDLGAAVVSSPLVRVRGYTGTVPPVLGASGEVFVSLDEARDVLWITLAGSRTGTVRITAE